jgi:hypothetical protein
MKILAKAVTIVCVSVVESVAMTVADVAKNVAMIVANAVVIVATGAVRTLAIYVRFYVAAFLFLRMLLLITIVMAIIAVIANGKMREL